MNKEQMIAALNDLKYKIDLGKLDNFNIEERNNQLNEIANNLQDISKQIKNLEDKIGDESNYKEGSEYDLAQKEQQRLEGAVLNAETLLQNNKSSIASYNYIIKNENKTISDTSSQIDDMNERVIEIGRKIRRLGDIDGPEKENQERTYNEQLNKVREKITQLNADINLSNDVINTATNSLNRENNQTAELTNNLDRVKNNLNELNNKMTGLSLINEEQLTTDKQELENLKKIEQNQKDREKVLNTTYSNALDGIIANLNSDKVTVPQAGEQLQELINNIPESYFINTEKERVDELRDNSLNQGIYQEQINELENKLNNKEKYFYLSNFRIEQMEDELARWDAKLVEYDRQLQNPEARIRQIDYEVNGLENIIKKHDIEISNAKKENDDYNIKYYENLKNEANEKIILLKDEKNSINSNEFKDLQDKRNRTNKIAHNLRTKIKNKDVLLDNSRIRLAEEKLRSSVAALNALKQRELFLNESAKDMLTNTADYAKVSNEVEESKGEKPVVKDTVTKEEPLQYNLNNDNHVLESNIKNEPLTDSINKALKNENLGVHVNDINPNIVEQLNKEEKPNLDETIVKNEPIEKDEKQPVEENKEELKNPGEESKEEKENINKEVEGDNPDEIIELPENKVKATYKNAIDKLKEKAKEIKHNTKFAKWAKRLTALALAGVVAFGAGKMLNKKDMDDIQNPAITDELDKNDDKSVEELLKDNDEKDKNDKEENKDDTEKEEDNKSDDKSSSTIKQNSSEHTNKNTSTNNDHNSNTDKTPSTNNNSSSNTDKTPSTNNNSSSQYPSTNTHDNSDQISVPDDDEKDKDNNKTEESTDTENKDNNEVPDAVITDTDKEENKDDDNKVTIEDDTEKEDNEVTIEDDKSDVTVEDDKSNTDDENTYDNKDEVEAPVVNDNTNITIEDAPSNDNSNETKEDVYDNSNNVTAPDNSVTQETPSDNKIELFDGETYTNGDTSHENNTGSTESITVEDSSYQTNKGHELSLEELQKLRDEFANYNNESEMIEDQSMTI